MQDNITINLTVHEASWVRDALELAADNEVREGQEAWLRCFARGLQAKINEVMKPAIGEPEFSVEYSWQGDGQIHYQLVATTATYQEALGLYNKVEAPAGKEVVLIELETSEILECKK